jgi:hypothetical protein
VLEWTEQPPQLRNVPFVPGRRPVAEASAPGLGSSEGVALILPGSERDRAHLLYDVADGLEVRAADHAAIARRIRNALGLSR